ncbi:MFS transporter [Pandoraea apista]|uniref:MFS transporter n=1 Tax=Pandoraea apista TaxID=93218 RepID=A0ABX9ZTE6_9BURK|nr:MFS transporter [Pandoraea apista]PTE01087.1 aromatic acid/H+ symport family MFS transporter [Pandoraea apista]RRJ33890.1 MFS transporter [Pandoraea apista]RRJ80995.1 MFS transporter [Pandoraea apista]RSD16130.1 MFS transporter [Pandoraea apista]RSD21590.1 MFS transporter [Pandoraea apista]
MPIHRIDLRALIDERPFGRYQVFVTALCALIVFLDGFDAQAIGYVAPAIVHALNIERSALSPVFSASLVGLTLGALIGGPVSDRVGRRPVLIAGMLIFGAMSLATALAQSVTSLLVLRLATGVGLGCVMPNAIALTSEFAPERVRSTAIMVMFCGFSLGAALGGLAAAGLIRDFGWQSVFVVGGVLPLVAALVAWRSLPESPRFLIVRAKDPARLRGVLRKLAPDLPADAQIDGGVDLHAAARTGVGALFADKRARITLLLWVIFFMSLMDLYFLSSWLPTVIHDAGIALDTAALITSMLQIGGTLGTLTLGRVFDRVSPFKALGAVYLCAAVCVVLVGLAGTSVSVLGATIFGAGFCVVGGQIGANALAARTYPTAIRGTGIGWALGIGRLGSIVGPIVGGVLLALHWDPQHLFMIAALPVFLASVAAFMISVGARYETHRAARAAGEATS